MIFCYANKIYYNITFQTKSILYGLTMNSVNLLWLFPIVSHSPSISHGTDAKEKEYPKILQVQKYFVLIYAKR